MSSSWIQCPLCGCVQSARLWYNHFSSSLKRIGFVPNPYDQRVFNCNRDGKRLTLAMHVDDGLATCEDLEQLYWLDDEIRKEFNDEVESAIDKKVFDYLGVKVDTSNGVEAELTMETYILDLCKEHGVCRSSPTPASSSLFKQEEDFESLDESAKAKLHRAVAQSLRLATRVRPDVILPITYLCSRVSQPTHDDLSKLSRAF